uniref:Uncharacterized protein n=1 Tax=Triticum urartu TaxID=4572 RepID=A0A8R7K119_TRIUA
SIPNSVSCHSTAAATIALSNATIVRSTAAAAATPSSGPPPLLPPLPAEGRSSARICLTTGVAPVSTSPPAGAPAPASPPSSRTSPPIRLYTSSPLAVRTPLLAASQALCLHISDVCCSVCSNLT